MKQGKRFRKFGGKCAYCGIRKNLTRDHIVPKYYGGTNNTMNIQPLCADCNSIKSASLKDTEVDLLARKIVEYVF